MKEFKLGSDMVIFTPWVHLLDHSWKMESKLKTKEKKSSYKVNKMDQEKKEKERGRRPQDR